MVWKFTTNLAEFPGAADSWLTRDATRNTVPLTVLDRLRHGPQSGEALLGWLSSGERVRGVVLHTPPYPVLLADIPADSVRSLAEALKTRALPGVNGPLARAEEFTSAWGRPERERMAQRLYRLGTLETPALTGTARLAGDGDLRTVVEWMRAFLAEAEPANHDADPTAQVKTRIGRGEMMLWQAEGQPVSMAAFSTPIAGMSRVGPVYTPPEFRRQGHGSAVTHATTRAALDAGADDVLLFTDLANPTSNAIYQALGYRPVADYASISFA